MLHTEAVCWEVVDAGREWRLPLGYGRLELLLCKKSQLSADGTMTHFVAECDPLFSEIPLQSDKIEYAADEAAQIAYFHLSAAQETTVTWSPKGFEEEI